MINLPLFSVFLIPQRYVFAIMALFAVANAYTMRVCLNLAITQMVRRSNAHGSEHFDPNACPDVSGNNIASSSNSSASDIDVVQNVSIKSIVNFDISSII